MAIRFDKAKFADALIKIIARRAGSTLLNDINDLREAFGYQRVDAPRTTEDQTQDLLVAALADALVRTLEDTPAGVGPEALQSARDRVVAALPEDLSIGPDYFRDQAPVAILKGIRPTFHIALRACGVTPDDLDRYDRALTQAFTIALDGEFRTNRDRYDLIDSYFAPTPAGDAAGRTRNWQRYWNSLITDIRRPLLNFDLDDPHAVSLEQVYVPLRCWFDRPGEEEEGEPVTERVFTWLDTPIKDWLAAEDKTDPFRLISGEMGCGKSSFARMLAADLARANKPVLLVPLHRLGRRTGDTLRDVGAYTEHPDRLGHDLLTPEVIRDYDPGKGLGPLLLIFDGLDELTTLEGSAARSAREFVAELCRLIQTLNDGRLRVRALFVGRPLAVRDVTQVRQPGNRLHVVRFRYDPEAELEETALKIEEDSARRLRGAREPSITARYEPEDGEDALTADQAEQWWRGYQHATRHNPTGIPERWQGHHVPRAIRDLLAQPLLNFLVAIVPQGDEATSANDLYRRLFDNLFARETGTGDYQGRPPKSEALVGLDREVFQEVLQHIAVAAWHHGDRTVRKEDIESSLVRLGREDLKDKISEVGSGLGTILNSFFVEARRADQPDAYDFTHKSFREYLTARLLRGLIENITHQLDQPALHRQGYGLDNAADEWRAATAAAAWDLDLQGFFVDEIRIWEAQDRNGLVHAKDTLCKVFDHVLQAGLPITDRLTRAPTLLEQSANTEAAFMATLGACHGVLKARVVGHGRSDSPTGEGDRETIQADQDADYLCRLPSLTGSSKEGATDDPLFRLLCRLRARTRHQETMLMRYAVAVLDGAISKSQVPHFNGAVGKSCPAISFHLAGWDLSNADLSALDLVDANLYGTDLENADLSGTVMRGATLEGSNLSFSCFRGTDIRNANIQNSNIRDACLAGSELQGSSLMNSDLSSADLKDAFLQNTSLQSANLEGANLRGANLDSANLQNAVLRDAVLEGARLRNAVLRSAHLEGALLQNTNCEECNFRNALLSRAKFCNSRLNSSIFSNANLCNADFSNAILRNSVLQGAIIQDALLQGANFHAASLDRAILDGSDLRKANLRESNLMGASLKRAKLEQADLRDAVLTGAKVDSYRPKGINLDGAVGVPEAWLRDGDSRTD